jgi:hypothetical protein
MPSSPHDGSQRQPLAAIVRQALEDYLARQPDAPQSPVETAMTLAAMAARLEALEGHIERLSTRLDTLAASGPPPADTIRPPVADTAATTPRGQRKLTPRQQRALRDKHQRGVPVPALMEEYGLSRASVFRYLRSDKR